MSRNSICSRSSIASSESVGFIWTLSVSRPTAERRNDNFAFQVPFKYKFHIKSLARVIYEIWSLHWDLFRVSEQ